MKFHERYAFALRWARGAFSFLFIATVCLSLSGIPAEAAQPVLNGLDSSITIYVYPPRHFIDWSSPQKALKTFVGNLIKILISANKKVDYVNDFGEADTMSTRVKSSMGHTMGHVHCTLPGGEAYDRWSSLSGQDLNAVDKQILMKDQLGLGALFYDYIDGHIIAGAGNVDRLTYYKGDDDQGERVRPRYIQFEVDAEHCAKMKEMITFFEGFHFPVGTTLADLEKRKPDDLLYFTNSMDPYVSYMNRMNHGSGKVGGGCAPYAAALLKIAGRFEPQFDTFWKTNLRISERLIGGLPDKNTGALRKVNIWQLLFSSLGSRWDYSDLGYANRRLSLYDPKRIWDFTGNALACLAKAPSCRADTLALLNSERELVKRGQTRLFKGRDAGGGPVVQRVDGFVWRMR